MGALIRSGLAASPENSAFISFLHMPKPPWAGGTRLEPALGWFPLLLLKAQLETSEAESNSQQVNIHLQQWEHGGLAVLPGLCLHTHHTHPLPQVTFSHRNVWDPGCFFLPRHSKPPASAAELGSASWGSGASWGFLELGSASHSKPLSAMTPLHPPRIHRGAALALLCSQGGTSLQSMDLRGVHALPLSSGVKPFRCPGKGGHVPGLPGGGDPSCLSPPCPKDIIWIPVSEQLP